MTQIKSTNFIDREKLTEVVIRDKKVGVMSDELGQMIQQLSYNVLHGPEVFFERGDYYVIEEFSSRVLLYVCERWLQYDESGARGDAFSYFTKMITNAWRAQFKSLGWKDYLGQNIKTYVVVDGKRKLKRSTNLSYEEYNAKNE